MKKNKQINKSRKNSEIHIEINIAAVEFLNPWQVNVPIVQNSVSADVLIVSLFQINRRQAKLTVFQQFTINKT